MDKEKSAKAGSAAKATKATKAAKAAEEILKRRKARKDLYGFMKYCVPNFKEGKHFNEICDALMDVAQGKCKKLMISCPPRFGKSESVLNFVAWFMANNPNKRCVIASHSENLAIEQGRRCKRICQSDEFNRLYPNSMNNTLKTADKEFELCNRSGLYCVGVGGSLVGRGYEIGIIDDYCKGRQEANSEADNRKVDDWYKSVFYTRQTPTAAIVIIATRWSQKDLISTIIKREEKEWRIINLPALNKEGESNWPEHFPTKILQDKKNTIGSFEWSAQYMGEPTVREGNIFNCTRLNRNTLNEFPTCKYIRCWDLASTLAQRNKNDPDYTVGVLGAVKKVNGIEHLWIKDIVYGQLEAPKRNELIKNTAFKDGQGVTQYIESFAAYKDAFNILKQQFFGKCMIKESRIKGDKLIKAAPLEPIFEYGNVHILSGANWEEFFLKHFKEFPSGNHDDCVDATSMVWHEYKKNRGGIVIRL